MSMPSSKILPGDPVVIRGRAIEVGTDALQVLIDDGVRFSITIWAPARECARPDDFGELKPMVPPVSVPDR